MRDAGAAFCGPGPVLASPARVRDPTDMQADIRGVSGLHDTRYACINIQCIVRYGVTVKDGKWGWKYVGGVRPECAPNACKLIKMGAKAEPAMGWLPL